MRFLILFIVAGAFLGLSPSAQACGDYDLTACGLYEVGGYQTADWATSVQTIIEYTQIQPQPQFQNYGGGCGSFYGNCQNSYDSLSLLSLLSLFAPQQQPQTACNYCSFQPPQPPPCNYQLPMPLPPIYYPPVLYPTIPLPTPVPLPIPTLVPTVVPTIFPTILPTAIPTVVPNPIPVPTTVPTITVTPAPIASPPGPFNCDNVVVMCPTGGYDRIEQAVPQTPIRYNPTRTTTPVTNGLDSHAAGVLGIRRSLNGLGEVAF